MIKSLLRKITSLGAKREIAVQLHGIAESDSGSSASTAGPAIAIVRHTLADNTFFGIYLQQMLTAPADQYHDHPWSMFAIVLSGGYHEHYLDEDLIERQRPVTLFTRKRAHDFHKIIGVESGTWLLVFRGRQQKGRAFIVSLTDSQAGVVIPSPMGDDADATVIEPPKHVI